MTIQTLLICGAGYSALELVRHLSSTHPDLDITATTRDPDSASTRREVGARPLDWSVGDPLAPLADALGPHSALLYSIPTLFQDYTPPSQGLPRHVEPIHQIFDLAVRHKVARFIYLSSTSAYGDHEGQWVDEHTPLQPRSAYGMMRRDIEAYLLQRRGLLDVSVARLVGIYGPGRSLIDRMRSGRFRLVDRGQKISNRVHVHDIARALRAIITTDDTPKSLYNITDGHPQPLRDLVDFICDNSDIPFPQEETLDEYAQRTQNPNATARWQTRIRVRNDRLRRDFDFTFRFPDAFSGYASILNDGDTDNTESS